MANLAQSITIGKHNFFSSCISDIFRAISGNCLLGSFTLVTCAIGALSRLEQVSGASNGNDNQLFSSWVNRWMQPLNPDNDGAIVYAIRCALVHTHSGADALRNIGLRGYMLTHDDHAGHWTRIPIPNAPAAPMLNLESFLADFCIAAFNFFDGIQVSNGRESQTIEHIDDLIAGVLFSAGSAVSRQMQNTPYSAKHVVLAPFDERQIPSASLLRQRIHDLYIPIGRCKCNRQSGLTLNENATGSTGL